MGSVSSDDAFDLQSEIFGSYSLSADVSESESCSSFSARRYDADAASSSPASSTLPESSGFSAAGAPPPRMLLPVIGGRDVVMWERKVEKREVDLSGTCSLTPFAHFSMNWGRNLTCAVCGSLSGASDGVCPFRMISRGSR